MKEQPSLVKSLGYATAFARRSVDKIDLSYTDMVSGSGQDCMRQSDALVILVWPTACKAKLLNSRSFHMHTHLGHT